MPVTENQVRQAVLEAFPDARIDIHEDDDHHIVGTIYSREFADKPIPQRNRELADKVRNKLGYEGWNFGPIFPLAPGETL